uniref:Uncharacterized protein n=1 Tax=Anguilla anguilla TaxID=7936 RepID=A0A0E9PYJ3_ANGAN
MCGLRFCFQWVHFQENVHVKQSHSIFNRTTSAPY